MSDTIGQSYGGKTRITPVIEEAGLKLYRLTLPAPAPGFCDFITPWLLETENGTLLIDPGPSATIPFLAEIIRQEGVDDIQFVLLTHVHIDHAGGVGDLISLFPGAQIISHPRSFKHLVNPSHLWQSSLEVLGELAVRYGPVTGVPEHSLIEDPSGAVPGLTIIDTPGHSSHHQSYIFTHGDTKILFPGEAAGIYLGRDYISLLPRPGFSSTWHVNP